MAFREIKTFDTPNENLFEPEHPIKEIRAAIPTLCSSRFSWVRSNPLALVTFRNVTTIIAALVLIYLGVTLGGSYFGPASGKFSGIMATIFYQYYGGTIMTTVGLIAIYDVLCRSR